MEPQRLYRYIEGNFDLRLSGAEKMLIRQASGGLFNDNAAITARQTLERYYFSSRTFNSFAGLVHEYEVGFADYYESRAKKNEN